MSQMNKEKFFELLYNLNGICRVDEEMCNMLQKFQPDVTDEAVMVFAMYFSLIGDGNVCMCLEPEVLKAKWAAKWHGLVAAADLTDEEAKQCVDLDFSEIISKGTDNIKKGLDKIVVNEGDEEKLFVVKKYDGQDWIFTTKYYHAVKSVSHKLGTLLKPVDMTNVDAEKQKVVDYFKDKSGIELKNKQAEAVVRGQKENLIISGGPGYGKTTVVCYLLWKLLENDKNILNTYTIYLAAPSGKAQDRLKESINDELKRLENENHDIFAKLTNAQSFTIHRLLSYNPGNNNFSYDKDHQFSKNSIFVIDEASMIDICLFQKLIEAIPDGARLFILGDPYQLPSVQAGAVLGDILDSGNNVVKNIVELDYSNRFKSDSVLGALAKKIKEQNGADFEFENWCAESHFDLNNGKKDYPVRYISLESKDKKKQKAQINDLVDKWVKRFCDYKKDCILSDDVTEDDLSSLWSKINSARILCAERRGKIGVETLNRMVSEMVGNVKSGNYPGQQLIITQNQKMLELYNGDCGVVVTFRGNKTPFMMIEKPSVNNSNSDYLADVSMKRKGRFLFYPIHVIPSDSIELAYAITIHKAQGSGYENIIVFIPEKLEHPLLNNQIIYTAVTRSKGCTYIVGNNETMKKAVETKIVRDTKIKVEQ